MQTVILSRVVLWYRKGVWKSLFILYISPPFHFNMGRICAALGLTLLCAVSCFAAGSTADFASPFSPLALRRHFNGKPMSVAEPACLTLRGGGEDGTVPHHQSFNFQLKFQSEPPLLQSSPSFCPLPSIPVPERRFEQHVSFSPDTRTDER